MSDESHIDFNEFDKHRAREVEDAYARQSKQLASLKSDLTATRTALAASQGEVKALREEHSYRTSKVINFATDQWGGQDVTHLEIQFGHRVMQLTFKNDTIEMGGFVRVEQTAVNFHVIHQLPALSTPSKKGES